MSALLPAEAALLEQLEARIERGLGAFTDVGRALTTIRDNRLYRETHPTFASYLDERWQISRTRGYQLIDAASVADAVSTTVDKPLPNERVARELAKADDPADVWETVREINGDKPTAAQTRDVVQELKDPATDKQLDYLESLAERRAAPLPDKPMSKAKASALIEHLKDGHACECKHCHRRMP